MLMDTLPTAAAADAAASKTWSVRLGRRLSDCVMPLIHWATAGQRKRTCGLDVEMGKGSRSRQRFFGRSGAAAGG